MYDASGFASLLPINGFTPIVQAVCVGCVTGQTTYRLLVEIPDTARSLYAVYGDTDNPLILPPAWNAQVGDTQFGGPNPMFFTAVPELEYTSYITVGLTEGASGLSSDSVMESDLAAWTDEVELSCSDGAVFWTNPDTPCLLYTSPSPRDATLSRMPSSA